MNFGKECILIFAFVFGFSCAAHTLDLIAKADLNKALQSNDLKSVNRTHVNAFAKCSQIWIGVRRPKSSEAMKDLLGKDLPYPVCTRWGTEYNSVSALLGEEEKSPGTLEKLLDLSQTDRKKLSPFTQHELQYLREYSSLTAPLAIGIDTLQGDRNTFYGDLLPTLFTIRDKLENSKNLPILGKVAEKLLKSLVENRFVDEFELGENATSAICATLSHPRYKARWGSKGDAEKALNFFKVKFDSFAGDGFNDESQPQTDQQTQGFIMLRSSSLSTANPELNRYLDSPQTNLTMLKDFPTIRKMFFKYNTQLPTSAPVERMFNFAGLLDHPKRTRILPDNFEYNVIIKANSAFSSGEM